MSRFHPSSRVSLWCVESAHACFASGCLLYRPLSAARFCCRLQPSGLVVPSLALTFRVSVGLFFLFFESVRCAPSELPPVVRSFARPSTLLTPAGSRFPPKHRLSLSHLLPPPPPSHPSVLTPKDVVAHRSPSCSPGCCPHPPVRRRCRRWCRSLRIHQDPQGCRR